MDSSEYKCINTIYSLKALAAGEYQLFQQMRKHNDQLSNK